MKVPGFVGLALLLLIALSGCSDPPVPPEVQQALDQEQDLRRAGAGFYDPAGFADFLAALQASRDRLSGERSRPAWFRNYADAADSFRTVLAQGEELRRELAQRQMQQNHAWSQRTARITARLRALRELHTAVKDTRLNSSGNLARIEVLLAEAGSFGARRQFPAALARLDEADVLMGESIEVARSILSPYLDEARIARWKILVEAAVGESRRRGGQAVVIDKLRRQLVVYHQGTVAATYPVGLGFNPIGDKLRAGDRATPEGRYEITGKLPNSRYFRALLINYPNSEDRQRFAEARHRKLIPANARIGGLIEIHGGGKDNTTLGCIGLNDKHMLELFNRIDIGTPVVIVPVLHTDNLVRQALARLQ